jgi:amphi-Trp domain-containing protein
MKNESQAEIVRFRHESLQDCESIQKILKALAKGIAKGELQFSDEQGVIRMQPQGLLDLKLVASREDGQQRLNLKINWQEIGDEKKLKSRLKVL